MLNGRHDGQPDLGPFPGEDFYKQLLDSLYDGVYFVDRERRITYWNKAAERLTGYRSDEVCGRRCQDNILVHTGRDGVGLCLNGCPITAALADGKTHENDAFLLHKDGYRRPVLVRAIPIRNPAGEITGAVELFSDNSAQTVSAHRIAELEAIAYLDPLTGLANRRFTEITLAAKLNEFDRYQAGFGLLMIDLDHFKQVNDLHGHDAGDQVLRVTSKTIAASLRSFDFPGRWGGEEFVAMIARATAPVLAQVAERCRALVEASRTSLSSKVLRPTISIGGTLVRSGDSPATIVRRADQLMYRSKHAGRNRVSLDCAPEARGTAPG